MFKPTVHRLAVLSGLGATLCTAPASAAIVTWTLSDADMPSYLFGAITWVTGMFTTNTANNSFANTTSAITVADPYGKSFNYSGPIGGADYMWTYDTGEPCVIAYCIGDIIGIADGDDGGMVLATPNAPYPAAWILMLFGLGAIGGALRRRREAAAAPG